MRLLTLGSCQVVALEGLRGLYKGFGAVLAGVLPATMLYFWSYETAKKVVPPRYGAAGDFTVGAIAQLTAGVIFTPVDIIKERLQVAPFSQCWAMQS